MNTTDKNTLIAEFMGVPQPIKNSNGVWEDEELENHEDNLQRLFWLKCSDIMDM